MKQNIKFMIPDKPFCVMVVIEGETKKPFFVKNVIEDEKTITFIGEYIRDIITTPTKIFNIQEPIDQQVALTIPKEGETIMLIREFMMNEVTNSISAVNKLKNKVMEGKCPFVETNKDAAITLFELLIDTLKKAQKKAINQKNIAKRREKNRLI